MLCLHSPSERKQGPAPLNLRNPMFVDFDYDHKQKMLTEQQDSSLAKLNADIHPPKKRIFSQKDLVGNQINKIPINNVQRRMGDNHGLKEAKNVRGIFNRSTQQPMNHNQQMDQPVPPTHHYQPQNYQPPPPQYDQHPPQYVKQSYDQPPPQYNQAPPPQYNQAPPQYNQLPPQQSYQPPAEQYNPPPAYQPPSRPDNRYDPPMQEQVPQAPSEMGNSRQKRLDEKKSLRDKNVERFFGVDSNDQTGQTPSIARAPSAPRGHVDKNGFMKGQGLKSVQPNDNFGVYNPVTGGQTYVYKPRFKVNIMTEDVDQVNRAMLAKFEREPVKNAGKYTTTAQEVGRYQHDQIY